MALTKDTVQAVTGLGVRNAVIGRVAELKFKSLGAAGAEAVWHTLLERCTGPEAALREAVNYRSRKVGSSAPRTSLSDPSRTSRAGHAQQPAGSRPGSHGGGRWSACDVCGKVVKNSRMPSHIVSSA